MAWLPRLLVVLVMLLLGPHVGKFAVLSLPPRTTSVLPLMPVQHATTDAAARPAGRRSMSPEALPPMTAWRLWSLETVPGAVDGSGGASRPRGRWRVLTRHRRSGGEHQDQTKEISDDQALQGRPGSVKMQWPRRRELLPFRNSLSLELVPSPSGDAEATAAQRPHSPSRAAGTV